MRLVLTRSGQGGESGDDRFVLLWQDSAQVKKNMVVFDAGDDRWIGVAE